MRAEHVSTRVSSVAGLGDPTALPQTSPSVEVPLAPQLLLMLLLAASCHYGCDERGMPVPEGAKHPDAAALVEGLALVLRHVGAQAAEVCCSGHVFVMVVYVAHNTLLQELRALVAQCVRTLLQACTVIAASHKGVASMDLGYRRQLGALAAFALLNPGVGDDFVLDRWCTLIGRGN